MCEILDGYTFKFCLKDKGHMEDNVPFYGCGIKGPEGFPRFYNYRSATNNNSYSSLSPSYSLQHTQQISFNSHSPSSYISQLPFLKYIQ